MTIHRCPTRGTFLYVGFGLFIGLFFYNYCVFMFLQNWGLTLTHAIREKLLSWCVWSGCQLDSPILLNKVHFQVRRMWWFFEFLTCFSCFPHVYWFSFEVFISSNIGVVGGSGSNSQCVVILYRDRCHCSFYLFRSSSSSQFFFVLCILCWDWVRCGIWPSVSSSKSYSFVNLWKGSYHCSFWLFGSSSNSQFFLILCWS